VVRPFTLSDEEVAEEADSQVRSGVVELCPYSTRRSEYSLFS
jgi:hypothetical protein